MAESRTSDAITGSRVAQASLKFPLWLRMTLTSLTRPQGGVAGVLQHAFCLPTKLLMTSTLV